MLKCCLIWNYPIFLLNRLISSLSTFGMLSAFYWESFIAVSDLKNHCILVLFTFYNSGCNLFDFIEHILRFSYPAVKKSAFKRWLNNSGLINLFRLSQKSYEAKVEVIKFGLLWYPSASADSCRLHLPVLVLPAGAVFLSKTGQNGFSVSARLLYERGAKLLKASEKTSRKFISSSVQKWLACLLTDAPASYLCNQSKGWQLIYRSFIYSLRVALLSYITLDLFSFTLLEVVIV